MDEERLSTFGRFQMKDGASTLIKQICVTALAVEHSRVETCLEGDLLPAEGVGGGVYAAQYAHHQKLAEKLQRITYAQERIQHGSYGKCERCMKPMWERLRAIPYAELCIDCQRSADGQLFTKLGAMARISASA